MPGVIQVVNGRTVLQVGENTAEASRQRAIAETSAGLAEAAADQIALSLAQMPTANFTHVVYGMKATPEGQPFSVSRPSPEFSKAYLKTNSSARALASVASFSDSGVPVYSRLLLPDAASNRGRAVMLSDGLSGQSVAVSDGVNWRDPADDAEIIRYSASSLIYVSSVSANDIPIGDDTTGNGSAATPYLSIDKALTAAVSGKVILLNGDPASPTTYATTSTFLSVTKGVIFDSVRPYGATIKCAGGSTRVINVSLTGGLTAGLGKVTVDGDGLYWAVSHSSMATLASVQYLGTRFVNFKDYGVLFSNGSKTNVTIKGCYFENDPDAAGTSLVYGGVYFYEVGDGATINITDNTMRLIGHSGSNQGALRVRGKVAGQVANCQRNDIELQIKEGLSGSGAHYGILLEDIEGHTDDSSVRITGGDGNHFGTCIRISPNQTASPLSTNGSSMDGCVAYCDRQAGMLFQFGPDAQGTVADGNVGSVTAHNVVGFGGDDARAAGLHGLFVGGGGTLTASGYWIENTQLAVVDKVGTNCIFTSGVTVDNDVHYRIKGGNAGKVRNCTAVERLNSDYEGELVQVTNNDVPSVTNVSSYTIDGNVFYAPDLASAGRVVEVATGQTATFTRNNHSAAGGAAPWVYQGAPYATFAAWQAAREATASNSDPNFTSAETDNYRPLVTTPLPTFARDSDALVDFLGTAFDSQVVAGAFRP